MPTDDVQKAKGIKSITEVLDAYKEPGIIQWMLKVGTAKAKKISQDALRVGTAIDAMIQQEIKPNEQVTNALKGWAKFKQEHPEFLKDIEDIQAELTDDKLIGHPDIVKKIEINDIKTGNQIMLRPKYAVQASKYALMAGKQRASILLLSKTNPGAYLYIWWDGELLDYFGNKVFSAFETILEYENVVKDMVRNYLEREVLGEV